MGYNIHITRQQGWYDEVPELFITMEEWVAYVAQDADMRQDDHALVKTTSGEDFGVISEGLSVWTKYSRNGIGGGYAWFSYEEGNIDVKNPDDEILGKMYEIAQALGARLVGDEGEDYNRDNSTGRIVTAPTPSTQRKWWQIWK